MSTIQHRLRPTQFPYHRCMGWVPTSWPVTPKLTKITYWLYMPRVPPLIWSLHSTNSLTTYYRLSTRPCSYSWPSSSSLSLFLSWKPPGTSVKIWKFATWHSVRTLRAWSNTMNMWTIRMANFMRIWGPTRCSGLSTPSWGWSRLRKRISKRGALQVPKTISHWTWLMKVFRKEQGGETLRLYKNYTTS